MTVCGRSNRARATASWSRSPRASDAVACALELQRAPLAPIRLRIGVHTGEVQLRDEGNYIGPTINRTARLRDLAHGGQTVLSGTTEDLVVDRLPADAWLTDLGTHQLRDLPAPGTGGAAVPSRPSQRVPAAARARNRCRPASSGAAHEFRGPRSRDERRAADPGRQPARDADRRRRCRQDAPGGAGRGRDRRRSSATGCGMSIWRRSPIPIWCRSRWPARWACPTSRAAPRWTRCCGLSATVGCCWCWTTASICWTRAPRWSSPCWAAALR